jgi:hypothetical protein
MRASRTVLLLCLLLIGVPILARANARLTDVTPLDGGCVVGPSGNSVERWDVEAGHRYLVRLDQVTECAEGGAAATLDVRVNSSATGNMDRVAQWIAPGVYTFEVMLPSDASCTLPVLDCTTPGQANTGLHAVRHDGGSFQAHLRIATFDATCGNPVPTTSPCDPAPTRARSWAKVKWMYR